ncbi:MAG: hypothetical protein GAK40_01266 [Burkholderia plantarii]|nr:MAG: hypothetical protein GAK40_01266 [Burkholderia plantarii]
MLIKQYEHRLPADYDLDVIRARGRERGRLWDTAEGLVFKAFALRTRGVAGAPHNAYTSIYLWQDARAATDFVTGPRFRHVLDTFGRPSIRTWLPIALARDATAPGAGEARVIHRQTFAIDEAADLGALREAEQARVQALARQPDTVIALAGIDVSDWQIVRFTIRTVAAAPDGQADVRPRNPAGPHGAQGFDYELAWLAAPAWR